MTTLMLTEEADWSFFPKPIDDFQCVKFAEDGRFIYYLWLSKTSCIFRTDKEFPKSEHIEILQNRWRGRR